MLGKRVAHETRPEKKKRNQKAINVCDKDLS